MSGGDCGGGGGGGGADKLIYDDGGEDDSGGEDGCREDKRPGSCNCTCLGGCKKVRMGFMNLDQRLPGD